MSAPYQFCQSVNTQNKTSTHNETVVVENIDLDIDLETSLVHEEDR